MTYHIITIGCQMNKSDSERIAGFLEAHGLRYASDKNKADVVVVTTCGVRQSAEDRIYGFIPDIKKANKRVKIIIAGCLSRRVDVKKKLAGKVDVWLPIDELPDLAKRLKIRRIKNKFKIERKNYLSILPKYQSKFSAFVPIGNGCDNFCAYCVVPYARGREAYRQVEEIVGEIKKLLKNGYKEINLIAQNVNSYKVILKKDIYKFKVGEEINFPKLLEIINSLEGDFWIRFSTSHPKDMSDELIKKVFSLPKVCEHIHLPVQAGDDQVLKAMNRKYSIRHYKELVKKIRRAAKNKKTSGEGLPVFVSLRCLNNRSKQASVCCKKNLSIESWQSLASLQDSKSVKKRWILPAAITTDIIVGFPGEARKQYENTVKLFKDVMFDMAYIVQYSPRPGTAAFKLTNDVKKSEKEYREKKLVRVLRQTDTRNNSKYLNKTVEVLVEKEKKGIFLGKTRTSKVVKIESPFGNMKIGDFVWVKIKKVQDFGLTGVIV